MEKSNNRDFHFIALFLGFISAVLFIYVLRELKEIFLPFSLALLLFFLFKNFVKWLVELKIPKPAVLILLLVFIFVLLYFFGLLVFTGAASFAQDFPAYSGKIALIAQSVLVKFKIPLADVERYLGHVDWQTVLNPSRITSVISAAIGSFSSFLGHLVLILLLLMFMLGARSSLISRLGKSISSRQTAGFVFVFNSIEGKVQRYLMIKTLMSLLTAVLGGIILYLGDIDFVIFFALLIFLLNYIPTFGSLVSTLFPALVGFIKFGLGWRMALVTAGLMALQFFMGNLVEPLITGRRLNLSPVVILLALLFWGWLWGVIGMFLAVPITSAIKIVFEQIDSLKPLAAVMSDE